MLEDQDCLALGHDGGPRKGCSYCLSNTAPRKTKWVNFLEKVPAPAVLSSGTITGRVHGLFGWDPDAAKRTIATGPLATVAQWLSSRIAVRRPTIRRGAMAMITRMSKIVRSLSVFLGAIVLLGTAVRGVRSPEPSAKER